MYLFYMQPCSLMPKGGTKIKNQHVIIIGQFIMQPYDQKRRVIIKKIIFPFCKIIYFSAKAIFPSHPNRENRFLRSGDN